MISIPLPAVLERPTIDAAPPLWPHQAAALDWLTAHNSGLLDIGMGGRPGGKSRIVLEHIEDTDAQRVLVVCPRNVAAVWPREQHKYARREWVTWSGKVLGARGWKTNPSVGERAKALHKAHADARTLRRPLLAAVNFEAAWQGNMATVLARLPWDTLVIDESHRAKSPQGRASKYLAGLAAQVRARGGRVLLLTGTPTPHDPLDYWAQMRIVNPRVLGDSWVAFRARYGAKKVKYIDGAGNPVYLKTPTGHPIYDGVREDRRQELADAIAPWTYRVSQADLDHMLGLGEPTSSERLVDLDPATLKAYKELEREGITQAAEGTITASSAMHVVLRLAQATSGYGSDVDTGEPLSLTGDRLPEKARALSDLLEDLPREEPVVVFARFHYDLDAIRAVAQARGLRYAELSGRRRDGITEQSTLAPDADLVGVQLQSGGVGIDLTGARVAVFYSLDFKLADHEQARKRLHRPGQERHVHFIYLLARGTVDHAIKGALAARQDVIAAFIAHMRTRAGTSTKEPST